jgi:hypothetical protein
MDGLLNQAKSKIWAIVNEVAKLTYQGASPDLEIAMYDYGNKSLNIKDNYIRQQLNFTKDLDLVSEKLFIIAYSISLVSIKYPRSNCFS